jgi:hypothetical protein
VKAAPRRGSLGRNPGQQQSGRSAEGSSSRSYQENVTR